MEGRREGTAREWLGAPFAGRSGGARGANPGAEHVPGWLAVVDEGWSQVSAFLGGGLGFGQPRVLPEPYAGPCSPTKLKTTGELKVIHRGSMPAQPASRPSGRHASAPAGRSSVHPPAMQIGLPTRPVRMSPQHKHMEPWGEERPRLNRSEPAQVPLLLPKPAVDDMLAKTTERAKPQNRDGMSKVDFIKTHHFTIVADMGFASDGNQLVNVERKGSPRDDVFNKLSQCHPLDDPDSIPGSPLQPPTRSETHPWAGSAMRRVSGRSITDELVTNPTPMSSEARSRAIETWLPEKGEACTGQSLALMHQPLHPAAHAENMTGIPRTENSNSADVHVLAARTELGSRRQSEIALDCDESSTANHRAKRNVNGSHGGGNAFLKKVKASDSPAPPTIQGQLLGKIARRKGNAQWPDAAAFKTPCLVVSPPPTRLSREERILKDHQHQPSDGEPKSSSGGTPSSPNKKPMIVQQRYAMGRLASSAGIAENKRPPCAVPSLRLEDIGPPSDDE